MRTEEVTMKPRATRGASSYFPILLIVLAFFLASHLSAQNLWTEIPLPVTNTNLSAISFVDSVHGCLSGNDGIFLYTSDGGNSWSVDTIPSTFTKCALVSSNVAWCFGFGGVTPGQATFFRSSNKGRTWLRKYYPDTLIVLGADFASENTAHLITPTYSWTTTDGGDSWHQRGRLLGSSPIQYYYPHQVEFFDDSLGYVGGTYPLVGGDLWPQMTTDGGVTWNHGYVGIMGSGGSTINNGSGPLSFLGNNECTFSFGWSDEISTQNFGGLVLSWNRLQDTVLLGPQMNFFNSYLTGSALNRQNIWLLRAWDRKILRTTNGGTTWAIDTLPVPVSDFLLDNDGHRFALGAGRLFRWNGIILGIEPSQELPKNYELMQNYPNPFNPTTRIEYQIPNREFVTLKVFDILGREVKTLVNEQQSPGTHHVEFDASNLSSGVYLYRLKAGEFIQQQKMLLIK